MTMLCASTPLQSIIIITPIHTRTTENRSDAVAVAEVASPIQLALLQLRKSKHVVVHVPVHVLVGHHLVLLRQPLLHNYITHRLLLLRVLCSLLCLIVL